MEHEYASFIFGGHPCTVDSDCMDLMAVVDNIIIQCAEK